MLLNDITRCVSFFDLTMYELFPTNSCLKYSDGTVRIGVLNLGATYFEWMVLSPLTGVPAELVMTGVVANGGECHTVLSIKISQYAFYIEIDNLADGRFYRLVYGSCELLKSDLEKLTQTIQSVYNPMPQFSCQPALSEFMKYRLPPHGHPNRVILANDPAKSDPLPENFSQCASSRPL